MTLQIKIILCVTTGLLVVGAGLLISGLNSPRYKNEEEFRHHYMLLGPGKSKEYRELRKLYLSEAISYQNYGITLMIVGAIMPFLASGMAVTSLPERRVTVAMFGVLAAMATIGAEVGSLFLDLSRGEFPWWADSIGIPLFGMPIVFLGLLCWVGFHVWLLPKAPQFNRPGLDAVCSKAWLSAMSLITAGYLIYAACIGDFWSLLPMAMWLGFYSSILKRMKTPSIAA
jgi:hypothetical protein